MAPTTIGDKRSHRCETRGNDNGACNNLFCVLRFLHLCNNVRHKVNACKRINCVVKHGSNRKEIAMIPTPPSPLGLWSCVVPIPGFDPHWNGHQDRDSKRDGHATDAQLRGPQVSLHVGPSRGPAEQEGLEALQWDVEAVCGISVKYLKCIE